MEPEPTPSPYSGFMTPADWEHYHQAVILREDSPSNGEHACHFMPSPEEVVQRILDLRWLQDMGFSDEAQDAIMVEDEFSLERARKMVDIHGPKETERRIKAFLKD